MRKYGVLIGSLVCSLAVVAACGTDDPAPQTTATTSAGGSGPGAGAGGQGTGGTTPGGCVEVTAIDNFSTSPFVPNVFFTDTTPALGGADDDWLEIDVIDGASGSIPLSLVGNFADCTDTANCVLVAEDVGDVVGTWYMASEGTLTVDALTLPYYITGSLQNVRLVEVNINDDDGTITEVPNGRCVTASALSFDVQEPVAGWTCDPQYYDDGAECDCECGPVDPDCSIADAPIYNCAEGQTCPAAECEGTPTAWTCDAADYDAGLANGCQCGCGYPDPDCALDGVAVTGCNTGELCNGASECYPEAWTCEPTYYNEGTEDNCDCGCGVMDPDCADANVTSCDFCDLGGSCNTAECPGTINASDNATCG